MAGWLVFDIETIPDAAAGRRLLGNSWELDDPSVRRSMVEARRQEAGGASGFLKPAFHHVVAIAAALIDQDGMLRRVRALGKPEDDERTLVAEFFRVVHDVRPHLAGWNSSGFDLPTLVYRAMLHQIPAEGFYRVGEPYHGYRKRFDEESHIDLMDLLSGYGASHRLTLHEMASVLGIPGKLGVNGGDVVELYESGRIEDIRAYCAHDVMTTALIFGFYAFHRGWMREEQRDLLFESARTLVRESPEPHWRHYHDAWQENLRPAEGES